MSSPNPLSRLGMILPIGFAFLAHSSPACAQNLSITAQVDKNVATLNDQIMLNVTVTGPTANPPEPELPSMPNFTIYSSGRSQNISIINGQMSGSVSYDYALTPRFPGKVVIGPISVSVQGKKVETAPIEVQIVRPGSAVPRTPGTGASPPASIRPQASNTQESSAPDVFVSASLDKRKAYVNEQVTLTVRFYTSVPLLGNAQYAPPQLQGFLTEDLPPERHGQTQIRGRMYNYSEIKTALFPAQSGRLTVGPAAIRCQVQSGNEVDPFAPDFFQRFFSQGIGGLTKDLHTERLNLQVEPLPEGQRPDSFNGAVGQFRIKADVDKRNVKVGDAITLTVTIEGSGNLKALGAPKLPEMPSFRIYDTLSTLNLSKDKDIVHGSKVFRTVLVPRASGALKIPSIPFSSFDPATGGYARAGTAPIELQVGPAAPGAPSTNYVATPTQGSELTTVSEDIRYIKETMNESEVSRLLAVLANRVLIHLFPLALFLVILGRKTYVDRLNLNPAKTRFRSAWAMARRRLDQAKTHEKAKEPGFAATILWDALEGFLSDKLNCAVSGMTLKQVTETVHKKFPKIENGNMEQLKSLWEELELLRFAGEKAAAASEVEPLLSKAETLLKSLDQEMRR